MLSQRAKRLLISAGLVGAAIPALAGATQESLLPPGFGDPKSQPPAENKTEPNPTPTPLVPPGFDPPSNASEPVRPLRPQDTEDSALKDLEALPPAPPARFYDLPPDEARPTDMVGVLDPASRGMSADAFGSASGAYLGSLMAQLEAPLPSRWVSITLRRALLSRVRAPRLADPVDFVAERTRLLTRMGEADAARMLAQSVDIVNYTPAMVRAAYESALAASDPAGLCPLVEKGRQLSNDAVWPMSEAMCAAMAGEPARATTLLDEARRRGASGVDLVLAEKVVGAGSDTRRSVSIRWDEVTELSPWRFGLASGTGAEIPERLLGISGPRMQSWFARAPMVPVSQRLAAAEIAAALGIFSAHSLVDAHALALDHAETDNTAESVAARLQQAFNAAEMSERLSVMRALWDEPANDPIRRYGRLLLTSDAAARIPASDDNSGELDLVVAALLAAGMDREAAAWSQLAEGESGSLAWALLAVGAAQPGVGIDEGRIEDWGALDSANASRRTATLAAALAGLGRIEPQTAQGLGVAIQRENGWTQALERAAQARQPGTVALLAGVGMQTGDWDGVPPDHLFRVVRALRQVGLDFEARMIAAEALTRI
ncbi:MAG TPA: hypothetical protein VGC46_01140 [Allosphingosinicella sp.]